MVKKYINYLRNNFILIFIFSLTQGYSQYKKIPIDSNYYWKQASTTNTNTSNCKYNYQIKYRKDTVINSITYNKYSTFGAASGNTVNACNVDFVKHGYLRQDTINKRVFILDNNFVERPLYNFSKVVGDTMLVYRRDINANITVTVTIKDSIQFTDGTYHKHQFVINSSYGNHFVEGLGSIASGLFGHSVLGYISYSEVFYCFGKVSPFNPLYTAASSTSNCYLSYTGINENASKDYVFKVFPNPANDKLTITAENTDLNEVKLDLTNLLGQNLKFTYLTTNDGTTCNLEDLSQGIYFLKIHSKKGLETIRFVKQ